SPLPSSISMVCNCPMIASAVYRVRAMLPPFVSWNPNSRPDLVYWFIGGRSHLWEFLHDIGIRLGPLLRGCRRPILTPRRAHFLLSIWRDQCIMRRTRDHTSPQLVV